VKEILIAFMLLTGTLFVALAALGILRMPDLLTRMQATSKAITLGLGCLMLAEALHFGELGTTVRFLTVIAFFSLTAPVAAHVIARTAYFIGTPLWKGTVVDELRAHSGTGNPGDRLRDPRA
jgi:multicomponent Na+:H+ antiporter subunit G